MKPRSTLLLFALAAAPSAAGQDLSRWRYHRTLTLDTSAAGAGVAGDVKAYPLAVALDETSFDFTQDKPDGSDLRFTRTPEGGPLPHHVERWDAGARRAAVWVKLDLVKGGDAAQSFVMHWGNPQALDAGSGKAVFDSRTETFDVNWTSGDHPVGIGNQSQFPAQGRFWDGVLDEARVLRVPKDDHWIKLDYESQREGSRLVRFGPVQQRARPAAAAARPAPHLLVVEKRAERLSAYDPASGRALWSVPAGPKPHEFALSRDGRFAFVTNYGVDSFTEAGPGANTITVIDLAQRERIGEIDLGDSRRPHGIEVAASGRLYVTADHPPRLLVIDPDRRQIVRRYELGQSLPHMLAVTRDETKAYTANSGAGTVSVVALDRDETPRRLEIGGIPQGFAWSEDGKRLFASNRSGNAVFVIDPARDEITGRLEITGHPARLRVAPGTPYLVVSLLEAGDVAVVDTRSLRVLHRAHVGSRSEGVTVDGSGRFGYVSCQDEDKVVRFSIPDARPVAEIRTGGKPDPLAVVAPK